MNKQLYNPQRKSIVDDDKTFKKIQLNFQRNKEQNNTVQIDDLANRFNFDHCKDDFWNPESLSLMYKTPLWDQSTHAQKVKLNQLHWIAYYSQIISDKIATIHLNQAASTGLYGLEDFRIVCDMIDLETSQERVHIAAIKKICEDFESQVFGERLFTFPMRTPFREMTLYKKANLFKKIWRGWQTKYYSQLASDNAFIACQYFTLRGMRSLSEKMVQEELAQHFLQNPDQAPIPSMLSYLHYMDESFHFNTSSIIGLDAINTLREPTMFERAAANTALTACQQDLRHFSAIVRGTFWHDPVLYKTIYKLLRSPVFSMSHSDTIYMMRQCFTKENESVQLSFDVHQATVQGCREYISDLNYLNKTNSELKIMSEQTLIKHMDAKRKSFARFDRKQLNLLPVIAGPKTPRIRRLELS